MNRRGLLAKIHCVKKDLNLDEDTYRDALNVAVGKRSAADMSDREIVFAIHELQRKARDAYAPSPEIIWKIKQLWHEVGWGNDLEKSLRHFLFSRFRISDVRFLDRKTAWMVVEAFKAMKKRHRPEAYATGSGSTGVPPVGSR